jgi:hypothetical protein
MFGLFLGFVAVGCGWTALEDGDTGTKILGLGEARARYITFFKKMRTYLILEEKC